MNSADRLTLLMQIENDIFRANPSFEDASGLLHALHVSLKRKYASELMWDCDHYMEALDKSLERSAVIAETEE